MFNLEKFIADSVTNRPVSMFAADIEANKETLTAEIKGKSLCTRGVPLLYAQLCRPYLRMYLPRGERL